MPKRKKVADPPEDEVQPTLNSAGEQSRIKHTEMLNGSFFRWIQDQHANHRSESWRNGVEEYLKYSKDIQSQFPVAIDTQAVSAGSQQQQQTSTLSGISNTAAASESQPALFGTTTLQNKLKDGAAGSPKPIFGFKAAVPQQPISSGATTSIISASQAAGAAMTAATSTQPSLSFKGAQAMPALGTRTMPASEGTSSVSAEASTPTVSFPTFLSAPSTSTGPAFPFSTPPTTSAPSNGADPKQSSSSSTPFSTSGTVFPPPGLGTAPAFNTAAASTPKFFAFGASQQAPAGASLPTSPGASKPNFSFGSPQPISGLAGAVPPDSSAAASTVPAQSIPQPNLSTAPVSFGSATPVSFGASSSQPAFGANQSAFGASSSQPASGSSQPAFGSSQPAFGSGQPAFGSSSTAFGSSQPAFGSGLTAFGAGLSFASSQPAAGFGASQSGSASPFPAFSAGQASSQPSMFGSSSGVAASSPKPFVWGPPSSIAGSGEAGNAASSAAANGHAAAPFTFNTTAQTGFGGSFGAPGHQSNGNQEEDDQAEPEEAVVFETTEGVLLRQEISWRHALDGKWGKPHKGKVLVCQREGDAQPHLQLQTSSGQVVSTARPQSALTMKGKANQLMGMLAVAVRHVDAEGNETYDEQKVWPTMITCGSTEAAKALSEKAPGPKKP